MDKPNTLHGAPFSAAVDAFIADIKNEAIPRATLEWALIRFLRTSAATGVMTFTSFYAGQRVRHTGSPGTLKPRIAATAPRLGTVKHVDAAGTVTVEFDNHDIGEFDQRWFRINPTMLEPHQP